MDGIKKNAKCGREAAKTCFLLLEPKNLCNSREVAERLSKFRGVKEVHLTSGRYGFIVSAKADSENDLRLLSMKIKKAGNTKSINMAVSHMIYR